MDDIRFPEKVGGALAGKTFNHIFNTLPEIIEFVNDLWIEDKTTGIFKQFFVYVKQQLDIPTCFAAHKTRCYAFVKAKGGKVATYMEKFINEDTLNKTV